jgi:hypothetical protein
LCSMARICCKKSRRSTRPSLAVGLPRPSKGPGKATRSSPSRPLCDPSKDIPTMSFSLLLSLPGTAQVVLSPLCASTPRHLSLTLGAPSSPHGLHQGTGVISIMSYCCASSPGRVKRAASRWRTTLVFPVVARQAPPSRATRRQRSSPPCCNRTHCLDRRLQPPRGAAARIRLPGN